MPPGQGERAMARVALELQPCCGNRSGIGTYAYELARRLHDGDGLEFQGNVFNFLGRNDNRAALEGISMPINECRLFPYGVYRRIWHTAPPRYDRLFRPADLSLFFNYIVAPRIQGKTVVTICDLTYLRFPETMNRSNLERIRRDIDYSLERSSRIITISEFVRRELHELLHIPLDLIAVVPCAPSLHDRLLPVESVLGKYGIRRPYLLYVGTIEPRKNLTRLLKAFEYLKAEAGVPHQLVLAGGSGWNNEEIYRTAKGLSCAEDVIFTGFVSAEEKNTLYKNAAAFIFPSIYEGFGIPPLEAMRFGCPVVAADAASLPEVVGDAARLVDPYDEASIANGIFSVIDDREYAQSLIQKGRLQEKKYTWDASAEKLRLLCKEVLKGT